MNKLRLAFLMAALCSAALAQNLPASQSSDNNVVVGNPSQPVQWVHRGNIQQAILTAKPFGTVWIPPNYLGTDCSPVSTCNPGSVLVIDLRGGQFNTFPTGSGTCSNCIATAFGRVGPVLTAVNTDYGTVGVQQVGTGNLGFNKTSGGTLDIGGTYPNSNANWMHFYPDNNGGAQILIQDYAGDQFAFVQSVGLPGAGIANSSGMYWNPTAGGGMQLGLNHTDLWLTIPGAPGPNGLTFDANNAGVTFNVPITVPSCIGCGSTSFNTDQTEAGTGTGTSALFSLPQGALKYNNLASGVQGFVQAGASDLTDGVSGSGPICRQTNCVLVNPSLGNGSYTTLTGTGAGPTQEDLVYNAAAMHAPQAGHSYAGVDSSGAYQISSNAGNYFHPGPSSAILTALCGGTLGTNNATAYIFSPAQQSVTTCTSSSLSATTQEVPFPAPGTIQNLYCVENAAGSAGDAITLYKNGSASVLTVPIGASTTGHDTSHTVAVAAGDTWSLRYVTNAANDTATGMRCTLEFVRTP